VQVVGRQEESFPGSGHRWRMSVLRRLASRRDGSSPSQARSILHVPPCSRKRAFARGDVPPAAGDGQSRLRPRELINAARHRERQDDLRVNCPTRPGETVALLDTCIQRPVLGRAPEERMSGQPAHPGNVAVATSMERAWPIRTLQQSAPDGGRTTSQLTRCRTRS
jgi:hypothetical protein